MDELKPKLEAKFGKWKQGKVPGKKISAVKAQASPVIYLMNRPASIQSLVIAGNVTEPYGKLNEAAVTIVNGIVGGEFTSRINMNLREDKHWTYGAGSLIMDAAGQRPFMVYTSVQSDKTMEAIEEIRLELKEFLGNKQATADEVSRNRDNKLLQIPGRYETMNSLASAINEIIHYQLDDSYFEDFARLLKAVDINEVRSVAPRIINPAGMVWVVVGDTDVIGEPLKKLGYRIIHIDADGNVLE
jgi:zinc protease